MDATRTVLIRLGRPGEAAEFAAFAERVFREAFAAQNRPGDLELYIGQAYGERRQRSELSDPEITTLMAEADGELAGFAQLRPGRTPGCVSGLAPIELWRFYVDRPFQGRGIARALMDAVLDSARARGADTIWLGVWERNPRAQAFYRKCGFVDVGAQRFVLGHDEQTDRVMARELGAP
ncbi:MAG TPA: GNAT family N-acetyltransferase [Gemmatimonadales bacterium]|nr:GNAT family N-acetyltransferase [Gemmatimonadales bacterium]